jgi:Zn-dependent metalloprotease
MKEPGTAYNDKILGKDPQPAHMKDYITTNSDNGGVHLNSGIPNRAFCLAAVEMGGYAWEKAGRIWYLALRDRLKDTSDFREAAEILANLAASEYGAGNLEHKAVVNAWRTVGVDI